MWLAAEVCVFFFFQAEDGIRDKLVTGVQTCALPISKVGIGTAPIGSTPEWSVNWGPQDENEAVRAIEVAIDLGVNWIDTAPFYGWGRAEQIVGKALRGKRDKVYIFTKCGTLRNEQGGWYENLRPESLRREVEASLRKIGRASCRERV